MDHSKTAKQRQEGETRGTRGQKAEQGEGQCEWKEGKRSRSTLEPDSKSLGKHLNSCTEREQGTEEDSKVPGINVSVDGDAIDHNRKMWRLFFFFSGGS